jgi:DNA uptake protein ComE-like DNA-binding protein
MRVFIAPDGSGLMVPRDQEGAAISKGYKLYVEGDAPVSPENPALIDINTCEIGELTGLGLTIAIAKKVIAARPFADIEALALVEGVDFGSIVSKIKA